MEMYRIPSIAISGAKYYEEDVDQNGEPTGNFQELSFTPMVVLLNRDEAGTISVNRFNPIVIDGTEVKTIVEDLYLPGDREFKPRPRSYIRDINNSYPYVLAGYHRYESIGVYQNLHVGSYAYPPPYRNPSIIDSSLCYSRESIPYDDDYSKFNLGAYFDPYTGSFYTIVRRYLRGYDNIILDLKKITYNAFNDTKKFLMSLFGIYFEDGLFMYPSRLYMNNGENSKIFGSYVYTGEYYNEAILEWSLVYPDDVITDDNLTEIDGVSIAQDGSISVTETSLKQINVKLKASNLPDGSVTSKTIPVYLNDIPEEGIYNPGGVSRPSGGGGAFGNGTFGRPESSDPVGNDVPLGSVEGDMSTTGFMTRYLCSSATLGIFGEWLWSDEFGLTVAKGVISLIFGSPAESVISLMSYPFDISRMSGINTHQQNIFWGHVNSLIASTALDSQSCYIDWGTIQLDEYWGNFLDYSPHTKIELYLPWGPGFVSIDPGQVLPGSIKVITNIDLMKGSCTHNVIGYSNTGNVSNNVMIGSYSGQCGKQIPVISNDSAAKAAGVVVSAVSAAVAPVIGAAAGAGANALGAAIGTKGITTGPIPSPRGGFINAGAGKFGRTFQILDSAAEGLDKGLSRGTRVGGKIATTSLAIARTPMSISRNGGFTDGSASLSIQYPYLIVSRPIQSVADNYGSHYGYPSNIYAKLSNLKGYTEVGEIHLENIPATVTEIDELDKLLKGGVIF